MGLKNLYLSHTHTYSNTLCSTGDHPHTAAHGSTLQHIAIHYTPHVFRGHMFPSHCHCNTLSHTATHCITLDTAHLRCAELTFVPRTVTATDCNRLQQTATDCNRLQQTAHLMCSEVICVPRIATATHCNTLQHNTPQHTATHCNTLQHAATRCNI